MAALVFACVASPTRDNAAARSIGHIARDEGEPPTAASYSQDGLVCLFDGIENAGWGVRDGSASSWTNLADGRSFSIIHRNASDYAWAETALVRNQASGGYFIADYTDELQQPTRDGRFSFEVVTSSPVQSANWQAQTINICQSTEAATYNKGIVAVSRREDNGKIAYLSIGKYFKPNLEIVLPDRMDVATATFVLDGASIRMYVNGAFVKSAVFSPDATLEGAIVRLGSVSYGFRGSYHCVRVYGRPLSDAEVRKNFVVDRERFGAGR